MGAFFVLGIDTWRRGIVGQALGSDSVPPAGTIPKTPERHVSLTPILVPDTQERFYALMARQPHRPPWMAGMPELQEHFPALRLTVPPLGSRRTALTQSYLQARFITPTLKRQPLECQSASLGVGCPKLTERIADLIPCRGSCGVDLSYSGWFLFGLSCRYFLFSAHFMPVMSVRTMMVLFI